MNIIFSVEEQVYRTQALLEQFVYRYGFPVEITVELCTRFAVTIFEDQLSRTMNWCPDSDWSGELLHSVFPWYYEGEYRTDNVNELAAWESIREDLDSVRDDCEIMLLDAVPDQYPMPKTWNMLLVRPIANHSILIINAGDARILEWEANARNNPKLSSKTKAALRIFTRTDVITADEPEVIAADLKSPWNPNPVDEQIYNIAEIGMIVQQGKQHIAAHVQSMYRPGCATIHKLDDV